MMALPDISTEVHNYLRDQWWRAGVLAFKLLPHQLSLYEEIWAAIDNKSGSRPIKYVLDCSRRFGKTTVLAVVATEFCLRHPGALIRIIAPTGTDLRDILFPIMDWLLYDCPEDVRPHWRQLDALWSFGNGAEIHMAGADNDRAKRQRGKATDIAIVDEAAFVADLGKLVDDVLVPTTLTRHGLTIIASTPPDTPADDYEALCREAIDRGAYTLRTIDDNTSLSEEQKAAYIAAAGGRESARCRREYYCEHVTETERAIVPEWRDEFIGLVERPTEFPLLHRYVGLDTGVRHYTAGLFGWYDFKSAKLVIESELTIKGAEVTTLRIVNDIRAREGQLWPGLKPFRRIADNNNLILIQDLATLHGLPFAPTTKDELVAMANELRLFVQAGRLVVHPDCKQLIGCLKYGIWDNKRRQFEELRGYGHVDHLAALIYLVRNLDQVTNPYPPTYGLDPYTQHIPRIEKNSNAAAVFGRVFGR